MHVRPYLTTGAAIVSAGALIAAIPAIVPSPTPPDVKVAAAVPKNPYVYDVKLQATLQEFVDIFFADGFDGITQQLLLDIVGDFEDGQDAINGFFDGGFEELVQLFLVNNNADPAQQALINAFFDGVPIDPNDPDSDTFPAGFTELVRQFLLWNNADPATEEGINAFFGGGASEFVRVFLSANVVPDSPEAELIDTFFEDGFDGLARLFLLAATPDGSPNEDLINTFFDEGFDGIARDVLVAAAPDAAGKLLVDTFFEDGFDGLAEVFALAAVDGNPLGEDVVNSFFSGYPFAIEDDPTTPDVDESVPAGRAGFVGLIHYVVDSLIGGVVPLSAPLMTTSVEEIADLPEAKTAAADVPDLNARTVDLKIEDKVEAAVEPDDGVTATAAIDSAPVAQPAVVPAPAPVPEPETAPPAEPVVDDGVVDVPEEEGEEEVVEVDNPGNKFTPPPILLYGNNGKRENPWRKAWQDTIKTVTGGGSTTPDAAPAPDNTGDPE